MAPKPPNINFYLHDFPRAQALCATSEGKQCPKKLLAETDKYIMLEPRHWTAIQNYIDLLVCVAEGGCRGQTVRVKSEMNSQVTSTADELKKISMKFKEIDQALKRQLPKP